MSLPRKYEACRGKYRVFLVEGQSPVIEAKKEDSVYYVKQPVFIEGVDDLLDLFVSLASLLKQIYDTDQFPK